MSDFLGILAKILQDELGDEYVVLSEYGDRVDVRNRWTYLWVVSLTVRRRSDRHGSMRWRSDNAGSFCDIRLSERGQIELVAGRLYDHDWSVVVDLCDPMAVAQIVGFVRDRI